jgi:hypothetical protein
MNNNFTHPAQMRHPGGAPIPIGGSRSPKTVNPPCSRNRNNNLIR